jgi:hypothetical protein
MQTVNTRGGSGEGLAVAASTPVAGGGGEEVRLGDSEGTGFAVQETLRNSRINTITIENTCCDDFLIQGILDSEIDFQALTPKPPTGAVF